MGFKGIDSKALALQLAPTVGREGEEQERLGAANDDNSLSRERVPVAAPDDTSKSPFQAKLEGERGRRIPDLFFSASMSSSGLEEPSVSEGRCWRI